MRASVKETHRLYTSTGVINVKSLGTVTLAPQNWRYLSFLGNHAAVKVGQFFPLKVN